MRPRKKGGWVKWVIFLLLVAGLVAGGIWYQKRPKDEAPDFKTATIVRGDLVQMVTANGQLNPVKSVQVGSQVSGIILEIAADFNSQVKEGDVIAKIDPATFQQSVSLAEAELLSAKAALELAALNNRRATELRKNDLIPASDADKAIVDLHQGEATVRMREAALERAKVDLARAVIYAPISGIVISRNVDVGQTVASSFNTPTLFQIANDLAKMQIDAMVSEADVGGVEVKQKVNFTVDAFPTRQFQGEVRQVRYAPTTNQNVVTYTTVVDVSNPDLKLRPGMTANASIITAERSNILKVPNAALRFRPLDKYILKTGTNAPAGGRGTNQSRLTGNASGQTVASTGSGRGAGGDERMGPGGGGGGSGGPGGGGGRGMSEEMRRRFESMSPEERAAMRERFRGRSGEGGRSRGDGPATRTVYVSAKGTSETGKEILMAKPVTIKTGITDGVSTELLDGLKEGDVVLTGMNMPEMAGTTNRTSSPFGGPFGGGFRGR